MIWKPDPGFDRETEKPGCSPLHEFFLKFLSCRYSSGTNKSIDIFIAERLTGSGVRSLEISLCYGHTLSSKLKFLNPKLISTPGKSNLICNDFSFQSVTGHALNGCLVTFF